jgi:hypothetical protein
MSVRSKLALTIFATGLLTALLVIATVVHSFQRFENQTSYRRGMAFLDRVVSMYDPVFDLQERNPEEFQRWLRGLVLYEPDIELYLLDLEGLVLAKTGPAPLKPGLRVAMAPVRESVERVDAMFVMGDDPERMDAGAVIVAKPVRRAAAQGRRRRPATCTWCCTRSSCRQAAGMCCAAASRGRHSASSSQSSR